jgi:hypothetical protein
MIGGDADVCGDYLFFKELEKLFKSVGLLIAARIVATGSAPRESIKSSFIKAL